MSEQYFNLIRNLIKAMGDDPDRDGLQDTPKRVVNSWDELFSGYSLECCDLYKFFEEGNQYTGMVYMKNIEFYSTCEHHLLPFFGKAHIGYIPNGKFIGASKLARVLDVYSRRLQIQERLAEQVTQSLMDNLQPKGAMCVIEAKHLCMMCRGVKKFGSDFGYSSAKGVFLESTSTKLEFLALIGIN